MVLHPALVSLSEVGRVMNKLKEDSIKLNYSVQSCVEISKELNDIMQGASKTAQKISLVIRRMNKEADKVTIEVLDYLLVEKGVVLDATSYLHTRRLP